MKPSPPKRISSLEIFKQYKIFKTVLKGGIDLFSIVVVSLSLCYVQVELVLFEKRKEKEKKKSVMIKTTGEEEAQQDRDPVYERIGSTFNYVNELGPELPLYSGKKELDPLGQLEKQGKYFIQKRIGNGTFANVYLAVINNQDRHSLHKKNSGRIYTSPCDTEAPKQLERCAIKVIDDRHEIGPEIVCGMILRHPNIVCMIDKLHIGQYQYLVYEFVDGLDLQVIWSHLGDNVFKESYFVSIFKQITSALLYCHQLGIVHRDIKMENIILYGADGIKLVDFGFAFFIKPPPVPQGWNKASINHTRDHVTKDLVPSFLFQKSTLTRANLSLGTKGYCAPELILCSIDSEEALYATDVYSLGVVLYAGILGNFPRGDNFERLLIDWRDNYCRSTGKFITKGLFKHPEFISQLVKTSRLAFEKPKPTKPNEDAFLGRQDSEREEIPNEEDGRDEDSDEEKEETKVDCLKKCKSSENTHYETERDSCEMGNFTLKNKLSPQVKDLMERMLEIIPQKRISLFQVAEHLWVKE